MAVQTRPVCRQRCGFERPHRAERVAGVMILRIYRWARRRQSKGPPRAHAPPWVLQGHSRVPKGATGCSPSPACTTPWANDGSIHESPALSSRRGDPCTPRCSLRSKRPSALLIDFPRKMRDCEDTRAECRRRETGCRKRERTRAHCVRVRACVRACVCVCVCVRVCELSRAAAHECGGPLVPLPLPVLQKRVILL